MTRLITCAILPPISNSGILDEVYGANSATAALPAPREQSDAGASDIRYPLRALFENGATLLGYSLAPDYVDCTESERPPVRLTIYWQRSPAYV